MLYKISIMFLLFIFYYRFSDSVKENHLIYNRLFNVINTKYKNKLAFTNKLTNNSVHILGNKVYVSIFFKNKPYYPKTYDFKKKINKLPCENFKKLWFVKEGGSTGGGSKVYPEIGIKNIKNRINSLVEAYPNGVILQENIESYLINNKKTDLRIFFVTILYKKKLYFYLQNDGFLRLSNYNYNKNDNSKNIHITNTSFQKTNKRIMISDLKDRKIIMKNLINNHKDISKFIVSKYDNLNSNYNIEYQIAGCDWIIDKNKNCFLLELNTTSPAWIKKGDTSKITKLKYNLKYFCYKILDCAIKKNELPKSIHGFNLIYSNS